MKDWHQDVPAAKLNASPLFRPEVLNSQKQLSLGAIRLALPISSWVIVIFAFVIVGGILAFVVFGHVTKKSRITGITMPAGGNISVAAPNAGIIMNLLAAEGQSVNEGDPLFELSTERIGKNGEITTLVAQQLSSRKQSLETEKWTRATEYSEKKKALAEKVRNLNIEAVQLEQEVLLAERRNSLAESNLRRYEALQTSGYVSPTQVQQKQEDSIDTAARLSSLKRTKLQMQANVIATSAEDKALASAYSTSEAQLDGALASIGQEIAENSGRNMRIITAPRSGIFITVMALQGEAVQTGQVLASIISESPEKSRLEAHLYAPSRAVGFVAVGQEVLIRYQAFPYQKFGLHRGTVVDVSKTPMAPKELPSSIASTILSHINRNSLGIDNNESLYRIKVRLAQQDINTYGTLQAIKPGMTLDADILQERRQIWEWFMEPILASASR
jgi:membrane fusion protein